MGIGGWNRSDRGLHFEIRDFWPDYEPVTDFKCPGIVIANHTSYTDMWMLLMMEEMPSFLSKFSVQNLPIVGMYAKMQQCIFFKRGQKGDIKQMIRERSDASMRGGY